MISDTPLPEGHTARTLALALAAAGAPRGMVRRAARGYYHDFLSPLALPEIALVAELAEAAAASDNPAALLKVRDDVIAGKHDASRAESDDWARSPEGQQAFRNLTEGR